MIKNLPANAEDVRDVGSIPGLERFPWGRGWQPTPVFVPIESHGQKKKKKRNPWTEEPGRLQSIGRKGSEMTEAT